MKAHRILQSLMLATVISMLSACTTLNPDKPADIPAAPRPVVLDSVISVPIKIDVNALASAAEARLPTAEGPNSILWITGLDVGNNATVQVGIHRAGPVSASTSNGCVALAAPLAIDNGRVDWYTTAIFGVKIKHWMGFGGGGNVKMNSCFQLSPTWDLNANLTPDFVWTESPWVDVNPPFGHIKISLQGKVDPILRSHLPAISQKANELAASADVKGKVKLAWNAMQKPIALSNIIPISLDVVPVSMGLGPITSEGNTIVLRPTLTTKLVLRAGAGTPNSPVSTLPNNSGAPASDDILISLQAEAQYSELNSILAKSIDGKTFDLGNNRNVTVDSMSISGYGPRLLVRLDLRAKLGMLPFNNVKGTVYLVGTPRYDDATRTLSVTDFDYDINTKKMVSEVADALIHHAFVSYVNKRLIFDMSSKVDPLRDQIKAGVKDYPVSAGIKANANITSFGISNVFVANDSLGIVTNVKGNAQLNVTGL